jgi:hypothetical protein
VDVNLEWSLPFEWKKRVLPRLFTLEQHALTKERDMCVRELSKWS